MSGWFCIASEKDTGKSINQILKEAGFTKKQISRQKFLPEGICLDKKQCRVTDIVKQGQLLELNFRDEERPKEAIKECTEPVDLSGLEILYEDQYLLAVNKPSGLVCHKGRGHYKDHLGSLVIEYFLQKGRNITVRQIGRLDRDTSGIVLFALDSVTAQRLWEQRQKGELVKTYYALAHGRLNQKTGRITLRIGKKEGFINQMCVLPEGEGLWAETFYSLVWEGIFGDEPISCVSCQLKTGRTHQIRVHFSATGHPLLGDRIYGREDKAKRLMLHAGRLRFIHPYTGRSVDLQTKIPWECC